ncbi:MAG TPA: hotdog fold thioesterase [Kofleriaceae bacterium]|nr:hotdog fold thioesterase [Kofleriaceae bacterium]
MGDHAGAAAGGRSLDMASDDLPNRDLLIMLMTQGIPFNRLLGMEVTLLERGRVRLEVPFRDELIGDPTRPALHGGVLSALIDTTGGAACFSLVELPRDRLSTLDLRIDYLRPGKLRRIAAEANVTRMGNRVASVDIACFHPDEPSVLIATGKGVYNIRRGRDPSQPGQAQ